ncbi:MAG: hypothetical protein COB12_10600 [Flavobacterium sp.]|nr:MAG: hypothetical protein COB12_10600 [Flavobacterium sp.]
MKIQVTFLFLLFFIGNGYSQKCSNYDDCISHRNSTNNKEDQVKYATKAIKYAKKEGKNPSEAYFYRGISYYYLVSKENKPSEIKKAEDDFLAAIEADPSYYWSYSWLGSVYGNLTKEYEKGVANYNKYISKNPNAAFPYRDRGSMHNYYGKPELALNDYSKAYKLIVSKENTLKINDEKRSDIILDYVKIIQEQNNETVYTPETLAILESALTLAPSEPYVMGEYALACFDNDDVSKALYIARKTIEKEKSLKSYEYKNSGASFVLGFMDFENKNYRYAANSLSVAYTNRRKPHPAVSFYSAVADHTYYATIATNLWSVNINKIKEKYNESIKLSEGTKFEYLIADAKMHIDEIDNPNTTPQESENQEHDFKQFLVNFNQLPSNYTLDYNTIQGRDISGLAMTKKYISNGSTVSAIGLINSCDNGYVFLLMYVNKRKYTTTIDFLALTTDLKGNGTSSENITSSQIDMGETTILGTFSIRINGDNYTINTEQEYTATGKKNSRTINGSCN